MRPDPSPTTPALIDDATKKTENIIATKAQRQEVFFGVVGGCLTAEQEQQSDAIFPSLFLDSFAIKQ